MVNKISDNLNAYHLLLSCYLREYSTYAERASKHDPTIKENLKAKIDKFIMRCEDKIDKNNALFMFKHHGYIDGVKSFSQ